MSEYKDFSSLPPEHESQMAVFEKKSVESGKLAMRIAVVVCAVVFTAVVFVVFSFDAPENLMAHDDLSAFGGGNTGEAPAAAAPAAADTPNPAEPTAADAEGAAAPAGGDGDSAAAAADSDSASDGDSDKQTDDKQ